MLTVEYADCGESMTDAASEPWALDVYNQHLMEHEKDKKVVVSNELVIAIFRALICEGKIDNKQIRFLYKGRYMCPCKDGEIINWPEGFCDYTINTLMRLI